MSTQLQVVLVVAVDEEAAVDVVVGEEEEGEPALVLQMFHQLHPMRRSQNMLITTKFHQSGENTNGPRLSKLRQMDTTLLLMHTLQLILPDDLLQT